MPFVQLVYTSEATSDLTELDVIDILEKAQSRNHALRISGLLIFDGRHFMQLLEGEDATVENLFSVIAQDPRHKGVQVIAKFTAATALMPTWAMAYCSESIDPSVTSRHFVVSREHATQICNCMPEKIGSILQRGLAGVSPHLTLADRSVE